MTSVFIIAECGSNWRFCSPGTCKGSKPNEECEGQLDNAYRMIRAAKECGADAAKFQWTSDGEALAKRRNLPESAAMYSRYVHFPADWLPLLKAECDRVGIEFMCTAYLPQDVAVIAPFVKRFKVAAMEAWDKGLIRAIEKFALKEPYRDCLASFTSNKQAFKDGLRGIWRRLYCVSKYPTAVEELKLSEMQVHEPDYGGCMFLTFDGLSDHTAHVLTGAVAVGAGARIIESHVRLHDTPGECPDWGHSLSLSECDECDGANEGQVHECSVSYAIYVQNVRTAERML